jgi:hypothetical protein
MITEDDVRRAVTAYEEAFKKLRNMKPGKATAGAEHVYGESYQYLVRLGVRSQLKLKYRG